MEDSFGGGEREEGALFGGAKKRWWRYPWTSRLARSTVNEPMQCFIAHGCECVCHRSLY